MKELVFDANSWHYKFAKWAGYRPYGDRLDICSYSRRITFAFILIGFLLAVGYVVTYALVHMLFGLVFSLLAGMWIMTIPGEIALFVISVLTAVFTFFWLLEVARVKMENRRERRRNEHVNKPDGYIKHAYKGWKEKYCSKIKFVRNGEEINGWMES